jgi:tRNA pseudouridine32 synthase/23S rRNA pseudouridine746 synthase
MSTGAEAAARDGGPESPLVVVHEDAHVVALDKPAGLLCVPGRGAEGLVRNLWSLALPRWPTLRIVHRLDQATSGLVLFALDADAHRTLSAAFENRAVDKRYEALVHGWPAGESGSIDLPLAADWPNRPRQRVDRERGKPSLTHWRALARGAGESRLELQPVTGRSHQLRVHLATIGHPVRGDRLYGPTDDAAPRLMLHANSLRLLHPVRGGELALESAVPF